MQVHLSLYVTRPLRRELFPIPTLLTTLDLVGAGYDDVDVVEAKRRGIKVSHTPGAVDEATATTAIYLILGAMRQFAKAETSARQGRKLSKRKVYHSIN